MGDMIAGVQTGGAAKFGELLPDLLYRIASRVCKGPLSRQRPAETGSRSPTDNRTLSHWFLGRGLA